MDENTENTPNLEQEIVPEVNPIEERAREHGWLPKEEYDGDPVKWVDAGEFIRRGELFDKIESQSKELRAVRAALEDLKKHNGRVEEHAYQRALKELKAAKKEAMIDGDIDRVFQIEEQVETLQAERQKVDETPPPQQPEYNPEFVQWVNKNSWYERDPELREFADAYGQTLKGQVPSVALAKVSERVRKAFPEKFKNSKAEASPSVEGASSRKSNADAFVLTSEERQVMQRFVASGVMSEKEYIDQLKKVRG